MSLLGSLVGGLIGAGSQAQTDQVNYNIAMQNLQYQRERNAIEDVRYADETAYNRAFAENERDYNRAFAEDERNYQRAFAEDERQYSRALQQEIFNREDTALERQASSLSAMGINPLSQQMSGLDSGQPLSSSTPGTSASPGSTQSPSLSSRGGQALHNDMKFNNILSGITPVMSMLDTLNGLKTGEYQRDLLKSQRDRQILDNQAMEMDNLIKAKKHGIKIDEDGNLSIQDFNHTVQDFEDVDYKDKNASSERNERENAFQKEYGTHDNSPKEEQVLTALENQMENNNPIGRAVDPILKTYNALKNPLGTSILSLIGLADAKIKAIKESKKKNPKTKKVYKSNRDWSKAPANW